MSDGNNSIVAPPSPLTVVAPNGGENWIAGTTQTIMWTSSSTSSRARLEYSLNNGSTWVTIVNDQAGGSYQWLIPNLPSDSVLIRATNIEQYNGCDYDVSNARFSIVSKVLVTAPNGGESWQATVGAHSGAVNISNATLVLNTADYYDNGGVTSNYTGTNYTQLLVPDNPLNKLRVYFDNWVFGGQARLIVRNGTTGVELGSISGNGGANTATFTSTDPSGSLKFEFVNANNGCCQPGWRASITSVGTTTRNITWNIVGTSKRFDIDYSINGGSAWTRIVSDVLNTTGIYNWQVPNTPSTQARVRVRDAGNNAIVDSSNANFTIGAVTPVFVLTTPNGGESFWPGATTVIKWYDGFVSQSVTLEYSIDNGVTWLPIASNYVNHDGGAVPTEGTYTWSIPNTPSAQCLVRVKDANNASASDVSNAVFTIRELPPLVKVTTPNTGASWVRCSSSSIAWEARASASWPLGGTSNTFKVEYSIDGGTSWILISANQSCGNPGQFQVSGCSMPWQVPDTVTSQLRVRVTDANNASASDVSDGNNSIVVPANPVTIISPAGGENWIVGTTRNITYTYGIGTTQVSLSYSINNGQSWVAIANNVPANGSYAWVIPNAVSSNVILKVTGNQFNGCDYDISNSFAIVCSPVTLVAPNGGENWIAGTTRDIMYTYGVSTTQVSLAYSIDNGQNWLTIANNVAASGSYSWVVPNTPSVNALVRVTGNVSDGCQADVSNAVFSIASSVLVTAPNGGESWQATVGAHSG
ncbi:MAG: hypothetical protein ACKPB4_06445, partial [Sphaerospermopsis kisseleviana]